MKFSTGIFEKEGRDARAVNAVFFSSVCEEWETPQGLFDKLNAEFGFTLDVCAYKETAKCAKYFTPSEDGLNRDWTGETVFCNPPYGTKQDAWIRKCAEHGAKGGIAVMLLPVRTDTVRFHDLILGKADIRFLRGRLKFGKSKNAAPFSSMVVVYSINDGMKTISSISKNGDKYEAKEDK